MIYNNGKVFDPVEFGDGALIQQVHKLCRGDVNQNGRESKKFVTNVV